MTTSPNTINQLFKLHIDWPELASPMSLTLLLAHYSSTRFDQKCFYPSLSEFILLGKKILYSKEQERIRKQELRTQEEFKNFLQ